MFRRSSFAFIAASAPLLLCHFAQAVASVQHATTAGLFLLASSGFFTTPCAAAEAEQDHLRGEEEAYKNPSSSAPTSPTVVSLLDPTPSDLRRGCKICDDVDIELVDALFFDSRDCMWPKKKVIQEPDTVVSCTLLSCLAVYLLCGIEKLTGNDPVRQTLLEWPRFFADHYHGLLAMKPMWTSSSSTSSSAASSSHNAYIVPVVARKMKELIYPPTTSSTPSAAGGVEVLGTSGGRNRPPLTLGVHKLREFSDIYDSFTDDVKFHQGGFLHPKMLQLVDNVVNFRRLFQWHFNFLNVACLWSFMDACERIAFERYVPRFYRVKVVVDMLKSMWMEKVERRSEQEKLQLPSVFPTPLNGQKYDYLDDMAGPGESLFPTEPISEIVRDSVVHGLRSAYNKNVTLTFVEIGVFQGRLAYSVLKACPFVEYFGVDPYAFEAEDYEFQGLFTDALDDEKNADLAGKGDKEQKVNFKQEMAEARDGARQKVGFFNNRAKLLEMTSAEAVEQFEEESVDFVFVDGDHRYGPTFEDAELWWPKVKKKGGILGGHDFGSNQEVTKAVMDFAKRYVPEDQKVHVDADWTWYVVKQ